MENSSTMKVRLQYLFLSLREDTTQSRPTRMKYKVSLASLISPKKDEIQSISSISLGFLISPLWWISTHFFFSLCCSSHLLHFFSSSEVPFIQRMRGKLLNKEINTHYIFKRDLQFKKKHLNGHN